MRLCPFCDADLAATPTAQWRFSVLLEPPSQNAVKGNVKALRARRTYQQYRNDYVLLLANAVQLHRIPRATKMRRIVFTRLIAGRGREYDYGNLVGGMKPLVDALHHPAVGITKDDQAMWLQDYYRQVRSVAGPGVHLDIQELP